MSLDLRAPLRRLALTSVRQALGDGGDLSELLEPAGDPGLFGPSSLAWQVHSDLGAMLIGGYSALMFQMLHPLAMAGVADHSLYEDDPLGRLQRTARYVAGTTYGPRALAEELVETVRSVHRHVEGIAPDGRPYRASDPDLLCWVHTCEVWSFLRAYQRYGPAPLVAAEKDAYLAEVSVLAELIGSSPAPTSVAAVRAYLRAMLPELSYGPQARAAFGFLRRPIGTAPIDVVAHRIVAEAAMDLLPEPARRLLGLDSLPARLGAGVVPGSGRLATRAAARVFTTSLRMAIGPSIARRAALERVTRQGPYERQGPSVTGS